MSIRPPRSVAARTRRAVRWPARAAALGCIVAGVALLAAPARGGEAPNVRGGEAPNARGGIRVVQVDGLLDPPNVDLVVDSIRAANRDGASLVVLQISSGGATGTGPGRAVDAILRSRVPVTAWVGPSGAEAQGAAAVIFAASSVNSVSPGSHVGAASPERLDTPSVPPERTTQVELVALASRYGRSPVGASRLTTERFSAGAAQAAGVSDLTAPTVGEFIVSLDGRRVLSAAGPVVLSTAKVVGEGDARRRQPNQEVRFIGLGLGARAQHTLTSPSIAYLLLVAGASLILFEFFAISIGLAGLAGALALVGAFVGFDNLPVHWWGVALVLAAIVAFGVDVQAGVPRFWTVVGMLALIAGSFTLYGGSSDLTPAWWVITLVCLGALAFMVGAMTSIVRSRFSTPTIGREELIGEMGTAAVAVDPDGVVDVRGARWRARTNRATPIAAGGAVRVVAVEGLVLEVEPEEGGARDYRDRARNR